MKPEDMLPNSPKPAPRQPKPCEEVWRLRDNETGRVQDIMPALPRAPSYDEIAERLMWQTRARLKESRQLLEAAKQTLRKTWKGR